MKNPFVRAAAFAIALLSTLTLITSAHADHERKGAEKHRKSDDDKSKSQNPKLHKKKLDLNTASRAELESVPGITPAIAQSIIAARPFHKVQDLKKIPGLEKSQFGHLRRHVTVNHETKPEKVKEPKKPKHQKP